MKMSIWKSCLHILIFIFFTASFLPSCSSSNKIGKNYLYFQSGIDTIAALQKETVIQPYDLLSIQVFSGTINQEQAQIFNIPASSGNEPYGYQVGNNGFLEMPVLGKVKAAGLTRDQLRESLISKLSDFVKNPAVIIRFQQFNINVLGEVKMPGSKKFQVDKVTIIDAISSAGDLTDYGRREDVTVIREENGKRIHYRVDLRSRELFESPVFLLQPNDIVYVSPNSNKLKRLNVDPEAQRKTALIFAVTSVLVSVGNFIFLRLNN